jgi:hypothetical protein
MSIFYFFECIYTHLCSQIYNLLTIVSICRGKLAYNCFIRKASTQIINKFRTLTERFGIYFDNTALQLPGELCIMKCTKQQIKR